MAKRIIILQRHDQPKPTYTVAFWVAVPVNKQPFFADPSKISVYAQATAEENGTLKDGSVAEFVDTVSAPPGSTLGQIAAILVDSWNAYQARVNAQITWDRYGTYWDGSSWTQAGVS